MNNLNFKKLLFINYFGFGDTISCFSMVIFLLKYYNKIYIPFNKKIFKKTNGFLRSLYFGYEDRIEFVYYKYKTGCVDFIKENKDIHICDSRWYSSIDYDKKMRRLYSEMSDISKKYIFSSYTNNPIYNIFNIEDKYRYKELIYKNSNDMIDTDLEISPINFYHNLGLNKEVETGFFNFIRDLKSEKEVCDEVIKKYNLTDGEKFNIICDTYKNINKNYILNSYTNIDIHNLVEFPAHLIPLMLNAEEIHLVEGGNSSLVYYLMCSKVLDYKNKVYLHSYCRNDNRYTKYFRNPKLENW